MTDSGILKELAEDAVVPRDVKQLRACLRCHLVKHIKQFEKCVMCGPLLYCPCVQAYAFPQEGDMIPTKHQTNLCMRVHLRICIFQSSWQLMFVHDRDGCENCADFDKEYVDEFCTVNFTGYVRKICLQISPYGALNYHLMPAGSRPSCSQSRVGLRSGCERIVSHRNQKNSSSSPVYVYLHCIAPRRLPLTGSMTAMHCICKDLYTHPHPHPHTYTYSCAHKAYIFDWKLISFRQQNNTYICVCVCVCATFFLRRTIALCVCMCVYVRVRTNACSKRVMCCV
jgi:hypothetical protein